IVQAQDNYDTLKKAYDEYQNSLKVEAEENAETSATTTSTSATAEAPTEKQLETALKAIDSAKVDLANYKNGFILSIKTSLAESKTALNSVNNNINTLDNTNSLSEDKTKIAYVVQINDQINSCEDSLKQLRDNLDSANQKIESCTIKAECTGTINTLSEVNKGDILQAATQVATILPNESNHKVMLYITNKDIANIKLNQEIKYNFLALPYKEYGYVTGKIVKISADATMDNESGNSYYIAEGLVDKNILENHKNEKSELKTGMLCNAEVITRDEKLLYYLLEKINLKD
ncbi:HlyD family efflux transporter periplasmic adaptor subunit, partial [Clostridium grantii]